MRTCFFYPASQVKVEVSPDGNSIVCWHPEPTIPYEHTKVTTVGLLRLLQLRIQGKIRLKNLAKVKFKRIPCTE